LNHSEDNILLNLKILFSTNIFSVCKYQNINKYVFQIEKFLVDDFHIFTLGQRNALSIFIE